MSETKSSKYAAYICYSHRDEKAAAWLHHHLERYRSRVELLPATACGICSDAASGECFVIGRSCPPGSR